MKYVSYIFEDQDVRNQVEQHEVLVEMAAKVVINHNIFLESYIYNNMEQFTSSVDLADTYSSIRDFVISENASKYSQLSEILADSQLSLEEKAYFLQTESDDALGNAMAASEPHTEIPANMNPTAGSHPADLSGSDNKVLADKAAMERQLAEDNAKKIIKKDWFNQMADKGRGYADQVSKYASGKQAEVNAWAADPKNQHIIRNMAIGGAAVGAGALGYGGYKGYQAYKNRQRG